MKTRDGTHSPGDAGDGNTVVKVRWSLIQGLHRALDDLYAQLSIPPLRPVLRLALRSQDVEALLESFPLSVCRDERHRLRCTGNVRLHQMAVAHLPAEVLVPCIEEHCPAPERLARRALSELPCGSACLGAHICDVRILAKVARRAGSAGRLSGIERPLEAVLCDLYGVDRRQIRIKPVPADEALEAKDASDPQPISGEPSPNARAGSPEETVPLSAEVPVAATGSGSTDPSTRPRDIAPQDELSGDWDTFPPQRKSAQTRRSLPTTSQ